MFFLLTSFVGGLAWADSSPTWESFKSNFSSDIIVCSDGWVSWIFEEETLQLGQVQDDRGRFHTDDMRVGFFDFEPLTF